MHSEDIALLVFSMLMGVLVLAASFFAPTNQELGWLAERQIQARQDCAELIKYRMRW